MRLLFILMVVCAVSLMGYILSQGGYENIQNNMSQLWRGKGNFLASTNDELAQELTQFFKSGGKRERRAFFENEVETLHSDKIFSKEQKLNKRSSRFRCDGRTYCSQMRSCEEAKFFLRNCPDTKMDGDNDGIPCERQWCN